MLSIGGRDSAVTASSSLNIVTVDARSGPIVIEASSLLILAMIVDVFKVEGMNVTRKVAINAMLDVFVKVKAARACSPENGQTDVDEKVCTAS